MTEIWVDVEGYEGLYQVSNLGRVRTVERVVERPTGNFKQKQFILKEQKNGDYCVARLTKEGKRKIYCVHQLVAKAFIPNPENKPEVNHKDLDKSNNCVDNLEWATRSENMKHAYDNGAVILPRERK
jgi:hypothetical protein